MTSGFLTSSFCAFSSAEPSVAELLLPPWAPGCPPIPYPCGPRYPYWLGVALAPAFWPRWYPPPPPPPPYPEDLPADGCCCWPLALLVLKLCDSLGPVYGTRRTRTDVLFGTSADSSV
ncbi:hypothetical protein GQ54DRAFT_90275 [Martensiomyces pterosporus]|nr:hypothetical protein GQ54DRAFT_90275 [Martensiomyces pterosporus]